MLGDKLDAPVMAIGGGKVLAVGTAKELTERRGSANLSDAFIAYLEEAARSNLAASSDKQTEAPVAAEPEVTAVPRAVLRSFDPAVKDAPNLMVGQTYDAAFAQRAQR